MVYIEEAHPIDAWQDDDNVKAKTRLDAIVTVVDAKHLPARLEDSHEAADQIAWRGFEGCAVD